MRISVLMALGSLLLASACTVKTEWPTISPCENIDCGGHGTCFIVGGLARCLCNAGYQTSINSIDCVPTDNPCLQVDCSGHGECLVSDQHRAVCVCYSGYLAEGLSCRESLDPCQSVYCSTHGTCVVEDDRTFCVCETGYHDNGFGCVANEDPCQYHDCGPGGECVLRDGVVGCACYPGYHPEIGTSFCVKDNACTDQDCAGYGSCQILENAPVCSCYPGYQAHGSTSCALEVGQGLCRADGWCWQNPLPTRMNAGAVWIDKQNHVWLAGRQDELGAKVLHKHGSGWDQALFVNDLELQSIWGANNGEIWAVGHNHYESGYGSAIVYQRGIDGEWQTFSERSGLFHGVWGSSADDVWVFGSSSNLDTRFSRWQRDAAGQWKEYRYTFGSRGQIHDMWGLAADKIWMVGHDSSSAFDDAYPGFIRYFDGEQWHLIFRTPAKLWAIWGCSEDKIFALGNHEGSAVIYQKKATRWEEVYRRTGSELLDLAGSGCDQAWAVGGKEVIGHQSGLIVRYNGSNWREASDFFPARQPIEGIAIDSDDVLWMVAGNEMARGPADASSLVPVGSALTNRDPGWFHSIWARAHNDVRIYGHGFWHFDGSTWAKPGPEAMPLPARYQASEVRTHGAGTGAQGTHWAIRSLPGYFHTWTGFYYFDGQSWSLVTESSDLVVLDTATLADDNIWALGVINRNQTALWHYDGKTWRHSENQPAISPRSEGNIIPLDDSRLLICSGESCVVFDGIESKTLNVNTNHDPFTIRDLWANSPQDIWLIGRYIYRYGGLILHWDGQSEAVTEVVFPPCMEPIAIWGSAADDVWVTGLADNYQQGMVLHFDGNQWTGCDAPFDFIPAAIGGFEKQDLWITDWDGSIMHLAR